MRIRLSFGFGFGLKLSEANISEEGEEVDDGEDEARAAGGERGELDFEEEKIERVFRLKMMFW